MLSALDKFAFASSLRLSPSHCSSNGDLWVHRRICLDRRPIGSVLRFKIRSRIARRIAPGFTTMTATSSSKSSQHAGRTLILGLTQYSHDASIAVVDATSGEVLFALSKERLTRRKHDGGGVAALVRHALREIAMQDQVPFNEKTWYDSVSLVVANNHHFRILPFENALPFSVSARYSPPAYLSPWNLIGSYTNKVELSHHLAHAYSAVRHAPFNSGLILIMDGMGDAKNDWTRAQSSYCDEVSTNSRNRSETMGIQSYHTDMDLPKHASFREYPALDQEGSSHSYTGVSFREAESAYLFRKKGNEVRLERLYKRWTPEISPPELYNHGFHDMQSVGAVYSRCATHIFGDWNACGKVMGLAPWNSVRTGDDAGAPWHRRKLMSGHLYDGTFRVNSSYLANLPYANEWSTVEDAQLNSPCARRRFYEQLAASVQEDLESVVLKLVSDLKQVSHAKNLVFAGGVALNSSLNGRIIRESRFDDIYIPSHPGDEGIAMGCAVFGYTHFSRIVGKLLTSNISAENNDYRSHRNAAANTSFPSKRNQDEHILPYLGTFCDGPLIASAVRVFDSWIRVRQYPSSAAIMKAVVNALAKGEIVAWFNGRSEFGPRALGNRSLLADPRKLDIVDRLNRVVKRRESFRPFAPTCLEYHVPAMFEDSTGVSSSPFMSATFQLKSPELVPAVAHVDGSARVQILRPGDNDAFNELLVAFHERTGIPMLLNTSFNIAGEPIVDSAFDAIKTFLSSTGIGALAFPSAHMLLRRRSTAPGNGDDRVVSLAIANGFRTTLTRASHGDVHGIKVHIEEPVWDEPDDESITDDEVGGKPTVKSAKTRIEHPGKATNHIDDEFLFLDEIMRTREVELDEEAVLVTLESLAQAGGPMTIGEICDAVFEHNGDGSDQMIDRERQKNKRKIRRAVQVLWSHRLVHVHDMPN